jgi:hypothetical protein
MLFLFNRSNGRSNVTDGIPVDPRGSDLTETTLRMNDQSNTNKLKHADLNKIYNIES